MKHVYRILIFLLVFTGTFVLFCHGKDGTQAVETKSSVDMAEPSFPTIAVKTQGYIMNTLHGYNSNLKANLIRESMTPLGIDRKFNLLITENETKVRKIRYELRKVNDNHLLDSGEISVMEDTKEGKNATLTLENGLEQGKEYALKITLVSDEGKKIHYFTRIKYYGSDSFLKEKMDFVTEFHEKTFQKDKQEELAPYLEYSTSQKNDNFASVDITSSKEMITWGDLEPKIVSDVVPVVKEFNIETAAICLNYYVQIKSGEGQELCKVKEFFRVRYSGGRMYLLKYNRDMQSLFDLENTSVSESDFKLGMQKDENLEMAYNQEKDRVAFVVSGELWSYYLTENTATRVFSFRRDSEDFARAYYDQHDIRIINIDEEGNMDFMVYGYMNQGDYEGCVGIVLYKFYEGEKRIEEQAFFPLETTYQILKENLDSFAYVSEGDTFYFSMQNVIYAYDLVAKKLQVIAKDVAEGDYCYVEENGLLAWQSDSDDTKSKEIVLLDLESKKRISITSEDTECILLVGNIDNNIVYGLVKKDAITEKEDGSSFTPMYKIVIANEKGEILKEYQEKNIYVEKAEISDDVVKLERVKKSGNSYKAIKPDSIQNQGATKTEEMGVTKRVTKLNLTEYYLYLRAGFEMHKVPDLSDVKTTVMKENKIVRLGENKNTIARYYVYAEGVIQGAYNNPAKAINQAEDSMGVVVNEQNQLVYERSGKYTNNQIGSISKVQAGGMVNSKGASIAMVLKYNHLTADAAELSQSKKSAYRLLKEHMEDANVLNLKGCTLDEVLYFVSGNRPVLAMLGDGNMVVITEYTESTVSYINPINGKTEKKSLSAATDMFKAAGNAFISYVQ